MGHSSARDIASFSLPKASPTAFAVGSVRSEIQRRVAALLDELVALDRGEESANAVLVLQIVLEADELLKEDDGAVEVAPLVDLVVRAGGLLG